MSKKNTFVALLLLGITFVFYQNLSGLKESTSKSSFRPSFCPDLAFEKKLSRRGTPVFSTDYACDGKELGQFDISITQRKTTSGMIKYTLKGLSLNRSDQIDMRFNDNSDDESSPYSFEWAGTKHSIGPNNSRSVHPEGFMNSAIYTNVINTFYNLPSLDQPDPMNSGRRSSHCEVSQPPNGPSVKRLVFMDAPEGYLLDETGQVWSPEGEVHSGKLPKDVLVMQVNRKGASKDININVSYSTTHIEIHCKRSE